MIYKTKKINYYEVPYCACFNSRKLARTITGYFDKKIKKAGINSTQFTLLAAVNYLQPISINNLSEQLVMDRTTLSRNINVLEKGGLCKSEPGREDKRQREISLTKKGMNTLERAYPLWKEAQNHFYSFFGEDEWKEHVNQFDAIIDEV